MKRGNVPTQSWSGKSAVFLMESALTWVSLFTQIYHKIVFIVLVKGSIYQLFFLKNFKFHKFVTRVIKMIYSITIINIDTPTMGQHGSFQQIQMYPNTLKIHMVCVTYIQQIYPVFLPTLF